MSDFLKKFSDKSYKDMKKIDFSDEKQDEVPQENKNTDTKVNLSQKVKVDENPSDTEITTFQTSNTKEEVYVRDDEKIKKRKKNIQISIISIILLIVIGIAGYRKLNEVRIPQFVNQKTLNDVQIWAAKNKINIDYTTVYSTKVDDGYVVKQSIKEGTTVQKGSNMEFVLSKGANPNERIKIPDFMNMSLTEIESWKQKNKAVNANIEQVFDDNVKKLKTIRVEYKTDGVDADNYRRKDKLNIVVSKGKETYEKDIEMPDFKNKSKGEVDSWAKEQDVTIDYEEAASDDIAEGNVISQSVAAKTMIAKKDTVVITVSKGKLSYVPNFYGLTETQGKLAATKANVTVDVMYYYSNSVPANSLISQSIPAGTEIKTDIVGLLYSLGKPYIGNFDGTDVYTMIQAINEMNGKGAQLTYDLVYVSNTAKKGTVLTSNYKGCFVNIGTHIVITVSNGN